MTVVTSRRDASQAALLERAYDAARRVVDPELPMLTLEDLGVLRGVEVVAGSVVVAVTPTYSGCPATATMRDDLVHRLRSAGFDDVRVRVELQPPWTTDWITERGRAALLDHGITPPGAAPRPTGPVPLSLLPTRRAVRCPRCGSASAEVTSEFGPTPCTALYRCSDCLESWQHVKEI